MSDRSQPGFRRVEEVEEGLRSILKELTGGNSPQKDSADLILEVPRDERNGDLSTSVALKLAKERKKAPLVIAKELAGVLPDRLKSGPWKFHVNRVDVAGAGFINFFLTPAAHQDVLREIHASPETFGTPAKPLKRRILLEFVSANPTGPLTVAHGRQAALGDTLRRILTASGYDVRTEYYNNDEGVQIEILGKSLYARIQEAAGKPVLFPENGYQGDYVKEMAAEFIRTRPFELPTGELEAAKRCSVYARDRILKDIQKDLTAFGVHFDQFFSQEALGRSGSVEKTLETLKAKGKAFFQENAWWLKSTEYGDDKDRVLVKSDGSYTYLTPDIAYHENKFSRGFDSLINIWGPDHHGYIARIKASQAALGHDPERIRILIAQLVTLYEGDEKKRMSTRAGEFVTLKQILDEVGCDAARYFFVMRRFDSHLDFDLKLAREHSQDNPVFYVQYAHARIASIERNYLEKAGSLDWQKADLALLTEPEELKLMRTLRSFVFTLRAVSTSLEPCLVVDYLKDLGAHFHQFYSKHKVLGEDAGLSQARMTLVTAVKHVIRRGLGLLGVSAPDRM